MNRSRCMLDRKLLQATPEFSSRGGRTASGRPPQMLPAVALLLQAASGQFTKTYFLLLQLLLMLPLLEELRNATPGV